MTQKEIDQKLKEGAEMIKFFGIRHNNYYLTSSDCVTYSITEKQFNSAKKRHGHDLIMHCDFTGCTKHIYELKLKP